MSNKKYLVTYAVEQWNEVEIEATSGVEALELFEKRYESGEFDDRDYYDISHSAYVTEV